MPGAQGEKGDNEEDRASRGINLWVVYGLMFLGFLLAMGVAALIVLPFYHRIK